MEQHTATSDGSSERQVVSSVDATLVLITLTTLLISCLIYGKIARKDSWEKYGVPQGKIGFNLAKSVDNLLKDGVDTVGVHLGDRMLITSDLHLLREILVKSFNNFSDRTNFIRTKSYLSRGLIFLRGSKWKRMRHIMSPSFSTSRMKRMSPCIEASARKLAEVLETCAKEDRLLEAKDTLVQYTSGIIARTGFGLTTDCLGESDNEFTWHCKNLIKVRSQAGRVLQMILFRVPWLYSFFLQKLKLEFLDSIRTKSDEYFNKVLQESIRERSEIEKTHGTKPGDFLQTLVSAYLASADGPNAYKSISIDDVIGQSLFILFAAFDTTSTTLQLCLTMLAMHPDIQERVYQEIMDVIHPEDDDIGEADDSCKYHGSGPSHDQLQQNTVKHYSQRVIEETLRLYPPASFISRMANQTTTINMALASRNHSQAGFDVQSDQQDCLPHNTDSFDTHAKVSERVGGQSDSNSSVRDERQSSQNITIPVDTFILIPVAKIHRDPRHYPDPEKFDPDRFLPQMKAARDPLAYLPFGQGPRQCIGMRMAFLEIKMALVHVLRKVKLELNDHTEPAAGGKVAATSTGVLVLEKPIRLAVRLRR